MTITKIKQLTDVYEELYALLEEKRNILVDRRIDELCVLDEKIIATYTHINKLTKGEELIPTEGEKEHIRILARKISNIEECNRQIISSSLSVINTIFDGILKITGKNNSGYTNLGKMSPKEDLGLSSIVEEA